MGFWPSPSRVKPGLVVQGPNVSFRRVRTLVRERSSVGQVVLFCFGTPLTEASLKVASALYERRIKVTNAEMKTLDMQDGTFHPNWNCCLSRSASIYGVSQTMAAHLT